MWDYNHFILGSFHFSPWLFGILSRKAQDTAAAKSIPTLSRVRSGSCAVMENVQDPRSAGLAPATNLLCDFEQVTPPLWASVSSVSTGGEKTANIHQVLVSHPTIIWNHGSYYPHFIEEKTEEWREQVPWLVSYSEEVVEAGFKPRPSNSGAHALCHHRTPPTCLFCFHLWTDPCHGELVKQWSRVLNESRLPGNPTPGKLSQGSCTRKKWQIHKETHYSPGLETISRTTKRAW